MRVTTAHPPHAARRATTPLQCARAASRTLTHPDDVATHSRPSTPPQSLHIPTPSHRTPPPRKLQSTRHAPPLPARHAHAHAPTATTLHPCHRGHSMPTPATREHKKPPTICCSGGGGEPMVPLYRRNHPPSITRLRWMQSPLRRAIPACLLARARL